MNVLLDYSKTLGVVQINILCEKSSAGCGTRSSDLSERRPRWRLRTAPHPVSSAAETQRWAVGSDRTRSWRRERFGSNSV